MWRRRLNLIHWPLGTKLIALFLFAILFPSLIGLIPTANQRISSLRQQNEMRLDVLGPYVVARTEEVFTSLRSKIEQAVSNQAYYTELTDYIVRAKTRMDVPERNRLELLVQTRLTTYLLKYPSLSRIRLVDAQNVVLVEAGKTDKGIEVVFLPPPADFTPADGLIDREEITDWTTVSDIYLDTSQNPALDIIYAFPPSAYTQDIATVLGYAIFTQNLAISAANDPLPNLYQAFQNLPKGEVDSHIVLLNASGQVISPTSKLDWLADLSQVEGYQHAQNGKGDVSIYYSALLNTDVLAYSEKVDFPAGPSITFLVESSLSEIDEIAISDIMFTNLPLTGLGLLMGLGAAILAVIYIVRPMRRLTEAMQQFTGGQKAVPLPMVHRRDEIGVLNNTFGTMAKQLSSAIGELETRVDERTRNLETFLEIGRVLTSLRDTDELLDEVVEIIHERFEAIYHVQIFLIDYRTNFARLRASTGDVGQQLLQRGHQLEVGSQSVIGSVTASGYAVVALDTSNNPIHKRNEFLPDTRAEMALPLRIGSQIIGALDLQSKLPDAFSDEDVELFQGMADQVTTAIENARLFAESTVRLQEIERLNRALTQTAWGEVEQRHHSTGLAATAGNESTPEGNWSALQLEAMRTEQIVEHVEGELVTFAIPVILRDQVLGAVEWQVPVSRYTKNARQTALELTTSLALTADNIRLFEQSRRTAQREALVNRISSKLTGLTDVDQILQTAVQELGLALHSPQTLIQLAGPGDDVPKNQTELSGKP